MLVHIENLVKRYGDLLALDHLSLDIEEGEISDCSDQTVPVKPPPSTACSHC